MIEHTRKGAIRKENDTAERALGPLKLPVLGHLNFSKKEGYGWGNEDIIVEYDRFIFVILPYRIAKYPYLSTHIQGNKEILGKNEPIPSPQGRRVRPWVTAKELLS